MRGSGGVHARTASLLPGPSAGRRLAALAAAAVLACVHAAKPHAEEAGADAAHGLIARMSAAVGSTDYQGSFIYARGAQIDALRIFHAGGPGNERERLVSMSGPRSEIVRSGGAITCLPAGQPAVLLPNRAGTRLLPLVPDVRGERFPKYYRADLGGEDRVAGYRTRIVDIVPRDAYRHGYRLWLEESTYLPLRSAVVDAGRHTLEQFMFVALEVGARPKESDLAPSGTAAASAPPAEMPLGGPPQWRVEDLPPGFYFLRAQRPAEGPTQAEHQLYTDGLANVSVYVEARGERAPAMPDRADARGALSIYTRDDGAWKITVLGDVPRATAQRIALSVKSAAEPAGRR